MLETQWQVFRAGPGFPTSTSGIYYIGRRGNGQYPLAFYRFASGKSEVRTNLDGPIYLGLSVSPGRQDILFNRSLKSAANLMMIENFR